MENGESSIVDTVLEFIPFSIKQITRANLDYNKLLKINLIIKLLLNQLKHNDNVIIKK